MDKYRYYDNDVCGDFVMDNFDQYFTNLQNKIVYQRSRYLIMKGYKGYKKFIIDGKDQKFDADLVESYP